MNKSNLSLKKYRSEIDTLRAFSVLAVVIYHLPVLEGNDPFLAGGFLGVDIFFVISGFLISGLIFEEIEASGKFNFIIFKKQFSKIRNC